MCVCVCVCVGGEKFITSAVFVSLWIHMYMYVGFTATILTLTKDLHVGN